jgi:ribosome-associated protein
MARMLNITESLSIPESELSFTTSRSSGPGGQHVNKVSSRVVLHFNVAASPSLSDEDKRCLLTRLVTRISKDGVLRVVSQKYRSQTANRTAAVARFVALLQAALTPPPVRHKTTVSRATRQRRLEEKGRRSALKQQRSQRIPELNLPFVQDRAIHSPGNHSSQNEENPGHDFRVSFSEN